MKPGRDFVPKPPRRDKPQMTLDRVLSRAGVASRTVAAQWIAAGRVEVDGAKVTDPNCWVEPARQKIRLDGRPVRSPQLRYFALHKPVGVITSHGDPDGRKTIYDVIAPQLKETGSANWLFSVGRLDQDTSGLLLLTNDSLFAERVANPEQKISKTYQVKVSPPLNDAQLERLRAGLDIGRGERSGPAEAIWLRANSKFCWIELVISEGKNRQVRRMIEALGHEVKQLIRTRVGKLELGSLPEGRLREISPEEVL